MATCKRTARRFPIEALEARWTPGGYGGLGGDFPWPGVTTRQAQVALVACGQETDAPSVEDGSKPGGAGDPRE